MTRDKAEGQELGWGDEEEDAFEDLDDIERLVVGTWYEWERVMSVHGVLHKVCWKGYEGVS